ncbi:hypothetical protein EDC01DRAFT_663114 [Geopyxis carbonaria]|nr:hypothetical protein EDC01DRAFT_663114 [Geopyxis carbonaria]
MMKMFVSASDNLMFRHVICFVSLLHRTASPIASCYYRPIAKTKFFHRFDSLISANLFPSVSYTPRTCTSHVSVRSFILPVNQTHFDVHPQTFRLFRPLLQLFSSKSGDSTPFSSTSGTQHNPRPGYFGPSSISLSVSLDFFLPVLSLVAAS